MTTKEEVFMSEGCPYSCPFCFNGKNEFKDYGYPPNIYNNEVVIMDDAFLSKDNVLHIIYELGNIRVDNKVVYYELKQGINLKDLTQDIANALHESRFKYIRFAWDDSYTKKNMQRVYDGIQMLIKAGYKKKDLMCYILSNYYVPLVECMYKAYWLLKQDIPICNCKYRKNYLDPKIYPIHWTMKEIEYFGQICRHFTQLIKFDGWDPEINKRLIRTKPMPMSLQKGII